MGYTTQFKGRFDFNKPIPLNIIESMKALEGLDTRDRSGTTYPGNYCQWMLTNDNKGVKWDGEEKFEKWEEWLNWLIRNFFLPNDILLSGKVAFQGEDIEDAGYIEVFDGNRVVVSTVPTISDELKELKEFRDFVLASDYKDELLAEWKIKTGREFVSDSQ
jgi:hypothetical protein